MAELLDEPPELDCAPPERPSPLAALWGFDCYRRKYTRGDRIYVNTFDRPLDECPYVLHEAGVIRRHSGDSRKQSQSVCRLLMKRDWLRVHTDGIWAPPGFFDTLLAYAIREAAAGRQLTEANLPMNSVDLRKLFRDRSKDGREVRTTKLGDAMGYVHWA